MSALVHNCLSCCCRLAAASRQQPCAHGGRRTVPHRLRGIHPVLALHAVARHLSLPSRRGCSVDPQKDWDKWRARRPAFSLSGPPPPSPAPTLCHAFTHAPSQILRRVVRPVILQPTSRCCPQVRCMRHHSTSHEYPQTTPRARLRCVHRHRITLAITPPPPPHTGQF